MTGKFYRRNSRSHMHRLIGHKLYQKLLFFPTDQLVKDFKGTSFSRSQEITTETDVSPLAVSKGFLEVDFDAVDHREDETSKTDEVDKDLNTTVNHADVSG